MLELALREALSLGHNHIGTEHILLALVREDEGVASRILLDAEVDPEHIRDEVIRMLSGPGGQQRGSGAQGGAQGEGKKRLPTSERNLDERRWALRRANEMRSARAGIKRDLRAGRLEFSDLIREPPPGLETAKVYDFLLAVPKHGRVKASRIFKQARISPSKTFGGLSQRQRAELLSLVA